MRAFFCTNLKVITLKFVFIALILLLALSFIFSMVKADKNSTLIYTSNHKLRTVNTSENWLGTPKTKDGRFSNIEFPYNSSFGSLLKWQFEKNPQKKQKKEDVGKTPIIKNPDIFHKGKDKIVWLGHASFYIQINGIGILTDPTFFGRAFMDRLAPNPFEWGVLENIDYLLISHNHFDHCEEKSIRLLAEKFPDLKIFTGLGMQSLIGSWVKNHEIIEAGWYQQFPNIGDIEIVYTPARHWSRRGMFDENKSLWGGFYIKSAKQSIYFMGDSGYGSHFKEISEVLNPPKHALMGVGAYKPEWFMHPFHMTPQDALKAFGDLKATQFIPMHYGTFDLADEPILEPLRILQEIQSNGNSAISIPKIGEIINL